MPTITPVPVKELNLDPRNARLHTPTNIEAIKASLLAFGQRKPIIINKNNTVLAGNGTLRAARELNWETIFCTIFEGTEEEERAYAIADNRSAELASWDNTGLADLLTTLSDDLLIAAGYTPMGVDDLLATLQEEEESLLPDIDTRFTEMASRSLICTYPKNEFNDIVNKFNQVRSKLSMNSNAEALTYLLDIMIGEPA